jgi:hypothetical protein
MKTRYELQTLPIGQDVDLLPSRILEVLNIRTDRNQFRALVELFVDEDPAPEGEGIAGLISDANLTQEEE